MSAVIIRSLRRPEPSDPESGRGHLLSGSRPAAGHSNSHRERGAYQASAIYLSAVFPVGKRTVCAINVRAGHTLPGSSSIHDTNSVRNKFVPALKASGSHPRFKRDHQPCRIGLILAGPAISQHVFHVTLSSYAVGSHLHLITGASACLTRDGSNPTSNGASV